MNLFLEIRESDLGFGAPESFEINYRLRKASRALIFNHENKIALMHVTKDGYHKLPGGGMNPGESIEENLVREIHEEVGADIMILGEIGITIEYRNSANLMQISYCYLAKVFGELHESNLDEQEKDRGFEVVWVSLEEAIERIENDLPKELHRNFMQARDLGILKEGKRILENVA